MISIVIVGYNSIKYLAECFSSIYKSKYNNFQIIFVNNTKNDGSEEYLKKYFPKTIILSNSNNLGFAAANNLGIKKAIELNTDYIFLLNPDTIIEENCLAKLSQTAKEKLILQPLVLLHRNNQKTDLINTTGSYLNFLGISYCNDYLQKANSVIKKDVPLASGAAMFFSPKLFKDTNGFDDSFFMYDEDMDLSWRARKLNYQIQLIPQAVIWHKYSYSKNKQKYFFIEKNRLTFLLKNFSLKYLLLIFPAFLINEILMNVYSIINGWYILKIKSYLHVIKNYRKILNYKKNSKPTISETKLKEYISSEINYQEIKSVFFVPYNIFLSIYWQFIKIFI